MQRGIKSVWAGGPTNSGNTRIKVAFTKGDDLHFYMTPAGDYHIPTNHEDERIMFDPVEAPKEYKWFLPKAKDRKNNMTAGEAAGQLRMLAVNLTLKLEDPNQRWEVIRLARIRKASMSKLGGSLGVQLNKIKENINNEEPVQRPTQPVKKQPEMVHESTSISLAAITQQKVKTEYGSCQIDKYNKRLAKSGKAVKS